MISNYFIKRPIFATVLSIGMALTGVICLGVLPMAQYPRITPPGVSISISYPGASAQEVADSVGAPIEQQVTGVEGMLYMSSQSGNDGSYSLTVTFDIGTDVNAALVLVQNRVALAMPQLPSAVQNQGITIRKRTPDMLLIINFYSPDGRYDDKYLSNFATIQVKDEMLRVDGISDIMIQGQRDYSMRVWLDPQKLAAKGLTPIDVSNAIMSENADAPAGRVGQPPARGGQAFQYPINTLSRLAGEEQFERVVLSTGGRPRTLTPNGMIVTTTVSGSVMLPPALGAPLTDNGTSNNSTQPADSNSPSADITAGLVATGAPVTPDPGSQEVPYADTTATASTAPPTDASFGRTTAAPVNSASASTSSANGPTAGGTVGSASLDGGALATGGPMPSTSLVRLRDVGRLELGAQNYNTICSFDGQPSVGLGLYQLPGTNALEVAQRVRKKMEEIKRDAFPEGLDYEIAYDTTPYIKDSVEDVIVTLFEAVALVAIVVLVFLQSWRAALIPLLAVPVAILGTFAVMAALKFSLNNISMFGLVLAIGIVVDDAIVVVENVERWMARGLSSREATYKAMEEVTGPIIAVALVLCAVFVPCAFIKGITGQFFRQFAITIAVSTVISTINSLTFSPAMAAILLRPHTARPDPIAVLLRRTLGWFFGIFNWSSGIGTAIYAWMTGRLMRMSVLVLLVYAGLLVLTVVTFQKAPKGFIPQQDQGRLIVNVQLSDSASLDRTFDTVMRVEKIARETPGVGHTVTNSGMSFLLQANSPNFASMFIVLQPFEYRNKEWYQISGKTIASIRNDENLSESDKPPDAVLEKLNPLRNKRELGREAFEGSLATVLDAGELNRFRATILKYAKCDMRDVEIMKRLRERWLREVSDAQVTVFGAAPVPGLGSAGGFKFMVEDKGGLGVRALEQRMDDLVDRFKKLPYLADAKTQFRAKTPQLYLEVDRTKAASLGVSVDDLNRTISMYLGSLYVNSYNDFGRHWQVTVQAEGAFRARPEQIQLFQVRNSSGIMIPLSTLVRVRDQGGPISVTRYNLYTAAPINGNVLPGVSDGDAIAAIDQVADETLPLSMRIEWTELMFMQIRAGDTAIYVFLLSVLSVFLALAALYESWSLPLAVILVVPLCLLCSVAGVLYAGKDVNIFVQIGLVVLVGLACKNAILIVEFAKHLHQQGTSCYEATREASRMRLRPIVMTSFAFIFGVIPLMFASGAGAEMRRSLGVAVFSGMLGVTVFGIFLTPVFFYVIQGASESDRFRSPRLRAALSYTLGTVLGGVIGFLFAKLGLAHLIWGPVVGAASGILVIHGVRGLRARFVGLRPFPSAFRGRAPEPAVPSVPPSSPPSSPSGEPKP